MKIKSMISLIGYARWFDEAKLRSFLKILPDELDQLEQDYKQLKYEKEELEKENKRLLKLINHDPKIANDSNVIDFKIENTGG